MKDFAGEKDFFTKDNSIQIPEGISIAPGYKFDCTLLFRHWQHH